MAVHSEEKYLFPSQPLFLPHSEAPRQRVGFNAVSITAKLKSIFIRKQQFMCSMNVFLSGSGGTGHVRGQPVKCREHKFITLQCWLFSASSL